MGKTQENTTTFVFGDFHFNISERCLFRDDKRIDLTPRTFKLLLTLVKNSGHLLEKEILMKEVWKDTNVEDGNLTRTISSLRKILGDTKEQSLYIQTVPRVGYRFIADVKTEDPKSKLKVQQQEQHLQKKISESNFSWKVIIAVALILIFILSILAVVNWRSDRNTDQTQSFQEQTKPKRLTNSPQNEQIIGWTNDGKLRFVRWINNNLAESYVMNPDGTDQLKEQLISSIQIGVWSPDGRKVIFSKKSDPPNVFQYIADADGANEVKLPLKAENPMWSSDGQNIVFQSIPAPSKNPEDSEVYLYNKSSGKLTEVTRSPGFDGDAAFSPDGKQVVFASTRDGSHDIYLMDLNGENVRRLTRNSAHDSFPRFTPDGTGITFSSNLNGENTDIYFMNVDGSKTVRLTDWNSNELSRSSCSPDGTKIAFNSDIDGNDEIYIIDLEPIKAELLLNDKDASLQTPSFSKDGSKLIFSAEMLDRSGELRVLDLSNKTINKIVSTTSGSNYPRFSPDGNKIAFHQEVFGRWDIFTANSDGSELKNLTRNNASDSIPNWFPDGKSLIFRTNRNSESSTSEVFSMNSDGSDQKPLFIKQGSLGWSSISDDGQQIIYSCDRKNINEALLDIYIASSDGTNEKLLLSRKENDMQAVFSPNGKKIVFVANSDGNPEIYLSNSDGTNLFRLTRNSAKDLNPVFSMDSKKIIFSSDRVGKSALYQIDIVN